MSSVTPLSWTFFSWQSKCNKIKPAYLFVSYKNSKKKKVTTNWFFFVLVHKQDVTFIYYEIISFIFLRSSSCYIYISINFPVNFIIFLLKINRFHWKKRPHEYIKVIECKATNYVTNRWWKNDTFFWERISRKRYLFIKWLCALKISIGEIGNGVCLTNFARDKVECVLKQSGQSFLLENSLTRANIFVMTKYFVDKINHTSLSFSLIEFLMNKNNVFVGRLNHFLC